MICLRMIALLLTVLAITANATESTNQPIDEYINQAIDAQPADIINQSTNHTTPTRRARNAALAYLTPWNQGGFTSALSSLHHFTHLSPVWHQMKVTPKGKGATLTVDGLNDIHWISKFRSAESDVKLVPRVVLEMNREQQVKLAQSKKMQGVFIKRIITMCENEGYDGIVLEATDFHALAREESMEALVSSLRFTVELGQQLHRMLPARELILVVRPWFVNSPYFQYEDAVPVGDAVDYYSLMTYDYSTGSATPGPNAPLPWMRLVLQKFIGEHSTEESRAKVLMGLNFYGMVWGEAGQEHPRPIVGHEFETLLSGASDVQKTWQNDSLEMLTVIDDRLSVYFPDAQSVGVRVDAANEWGVGVSVWELGQGTSDLVHQL